MRIYLFNAGWMLLEKILKLILTFIFLGFIAKQLGTEYFGIYSLGISVVTLLWVISSLGLDSIILKEFSQEKYNEVELFSTVFILRWFVCLGVVVVSTCFLFSPLFKFYSLSIKLTFLIFIFSVFFYNYTTYWSYYQAKSKAKVLTKISIIGLILSSLFKVYIIYADFGLIPFAISASFDVAINLIIIYFFNRDIKVSIRKFSKDIARKIMKPAYPMLISSVIIILYTRIDQMMIAYYLGASETGIYSVAMRISEAYVFLPALIATSFYPMIAKDTSEENVRIYFDIVFFFAFISGLAVIVVSPFVIPLLFGPDYVNSLAVLNITVFATMFSVLGTACTNFMILRNLGYYRLIRIILGLIINVVLNTILIPKYGIIGAAWATLISQLFASWLGNAFNQRTKECLKIQTRSVFTLGIVGAYKILRKKE
ncbi:MULTISPECIES: flippase [unclassified Serratia (in: enterobacteria)]|uniref:flippase n=1 Tax=unclassified Serratia (in: enterobacteria) TaxID=2647522 RepID=UPI00046843C3|nr:MULTISPECIES: flippase [unclassified Serratia (in: enterobacteria)]